MEAVSFGPFRLVVGARLLLKDGVPVELGARALEILIALISRPNEVINKRELMAKVWPDVLVDEGNLRFQIAGLRKAIGDAKRGARYIATFPGRGYSFVAPVSTLPYGVEREMPVEAAVTAATDFPAKLERMIGRDDEVATLSVRLPTSRFVTIVGSGGVGKTTVAVAVAHRLLGDFGEAALFLDLGMIVDPGIVPISLASMLGISVRSDDPTPGIIAYLRDKRFLLILDNCEHVIEAAADLAERIFRAAPKVHILATSREPLRVEGEQVHRLMPHSFPPDEPGLTAQSVLTFPAAQLFVERAASSGVRLDLCDEDAATVASICRKLDGVALAIELAAGRVDAYGLQRTAALLDERLALLWQGQRTASPRQKTMQATLDWSYRLLSEPERTVLRRLAVFVGHFTLQAALEVVSSDTVDKSLIISVIESLVSKSMVVTRPVGAVMRYRLLYATRVYALDIDIDCGELTTLTTQHAKFYCDMLEQSGIVGNTAMKAGDRTLLLAEMNNVRAALEWCFSPRGDVRLGVALACAAAPVFLNFSLLTECHRWLERALAVSDGNIGASGQEMRLQAALGLSLMLTRGNDAAALAALERGLLIAESSGDFVGEVELLGLLHMYHHRIGGFAIALDFAKRSCTTARATGNAASLTLSNGILGISLLRLGDLNAARLALEAAIHHTPGSQTGRAIFPRFDPYIWLGIPLAKALWLQGYPAQALERARQTINEAERVDRPVTLALALKGTVPVFLWAGDLDSAIEYTDRLIKHAKFHSLGPYVSVGNGFRAKLAIRQGDAEQGLMSLVACLEELNAARYALHTTSFQIARVQALVILCRYVEAIELIEETIQAVMNNGDHSYMPELLRVKGNVLLSQPHPDIFAGETSLRQALDLSRRQNALAWELRATVDLAELWAKQGRSDAGRDILQPLVARFESASSSGDIRVAEQLLASLASSGDEVDSGRRASGT